MDNEKDPIQLIEKIILRQRAKELEEHAKNEKDDYIKKADYYLEAAKIRKKIGEIESYKWNMANYHSTLGLEYLKNENFAEAREHLKIAEKYFMEIAIRESAFYCARKCISAFHLESKKKGLKVPVDDYFVYVEKFLEEYDDFSNERTYMEIKKDFYKFLSIKARLSGDYINAELWTEKCIEIIKEAYEKFKDKSLKEAEIYHRHIYWNIKARRLRSESKYLEAAKCYLESAKIIEKYNPKVSYDEYSNYYRCLALAYKEDLRKFEEYMEKSIEFAKKGGDESHIFFLNGLKFEMIADFQRDINKRIEYLGKAIDFYHKAQREEHERRAKFLLIYYKSQRELEAGNYKKAIKYLRKAIRLGEHVEFPNVLTSLEELIAEELLYISYLYISENKLQDAIYSLEEWLNKRQDIKNTKKYLFYDTVKYCLELLNKNSFSIETLHKIVEKLLDAKKEDPDSPIYRILSLTYAYVSLLIHNIRNDNILNDIRLEIISKIVKEETVEELRRRIEVQRAIKNNEWVLKLPPKLVEVFDRSVYHYDNTPKDNKHAQFRNFYNLIETILRILIEFYAKILWSDDWEVKIRERHPYKKEFKKFTLGDLINVLKEFRGMNIDLLKDLPDELFELLDKHKHIRNKLAHEIDADSLGIDITDDTLKKEILRIMYFLIGCFPITVKIIDTERKPLYDAEIQWNKLPKRIVLYYEEDYLNEGCSYYIEPIYDMSEKEIHPRVIVPVSFGCT